MQYTYIKTYSPNLDILLTLVSNSLMENKNYSCFRWDESDKLLKLFWIEELNYNDKQILDLLVGELQ